MPLSSLAFSPVHTANRKFLMVTYCTGLDALLAMVPEPLQVTEGIVK